MLMVMRTLINIDGNEGEKQDHLLRHELIRATQQDALGDNLFAIKINWDWLDYKE